MTSRGAVGSRREAYAKEGHMLPNKLLKAYLAAAFVILISVVASGAIAVAQQAKIVKQDYHIDGIDPGVRLFVRQKISLGTDDNIVLFIHGATAPSTCDFDLGFKDYSWADWMVDTGYVVYMFDKRNYGYSSREKAMDEPAANNKPVSRSYLVIRDLGAVVDHILT